MKPALSTSSSSTSSLSIRLVRGTVALTVLQFQNVSFIQAFSPSKPQLILQNRSTSHHGLQHGLHHVIHKMNSVKDDIINDSDDDVIPGDQVRLANNIRPSLNPTIINTIAQALQQRSSSRTSFIPSSENTPIQIMLEAASLASKAIQQRAKGSDKVSGDSGAFNEEESKLVAGRIIGVIMRLQELEMILIERANSVPWISKYGEEITFGLCQVELQPGYQIEIQESCEEKTDSGQALDAIRDDPLLRMCRAECLYALFLRNVELPSMEKAGQIPIDSQNGSTGGGIDFLESEKMEVLFPNGFE